MKRILSLLFLAVLFALQANAQCGVHCGTERWRVKTLTDSTVSNIDPDEVTRSIQWFRSRTRPASLPETKRLIGIETTTYRVRGVVLAFKKEDDKDIHVILAQPNNHSRTMIVEFKDPRCSRVCSSTFLEQMRQATNDFKARFGEPTTSFTELDDPVLIEVVGIGFFDRQHGQRGRAVPSGIEIHPVLSLTVNPQ